MKVLLLSISLMILCGACERHSEEEVAPFNAHYQPHHAAPEKHGAKHEAAPDHATSKEQDEAKAPAKAHGGH